LAPHVEQNIMEEPMKLSVRRTAVVAGIGATGAASVLAVALAGPGVALADPSPSASASAAPSTSAAPSNPKQADRAAARAQKEDALAGALATELGIDKAKVAAALTKVQAAQETQEKADHTAALKGKLDQAVTDGKLTRDQADAILKAADAGVLQGGGGGHHGGHGG
jgi:hypothetical protein